MCGNGVARQTTVQMRCGVETRLVRAEETTTCVYTFVLETTAACLRPSEAQLRGEHWRSISHDEL